MACNVLYAVTVAGPDVIGKSKTPTDDDKQKF